LQDQLTKVVRNAGRQFEDDSEIVEIRRAARAALDHPALDSLLEDLGPDLMPSVAASIARQDEEVARQVARQQREEELQRVERERRERYDEGFQKLQEDLDNGDLSKDEYLARLAELQAAGQGPTPSQDFEMDTAGWDDRDPQESAPPPGIGGARGKAPAQAKTPRGKPVVVVPMRKSKSSGALGRFLGDSGDDDGEGGRPTKKSRSEAGDSASRTWRPLAGVRRLLNLFLFCRSPLIVWQCNRCLSFSTPFECIMMVTPSGEEKCTKCYHDRKGCVFGDPSEERKPAKPKVAPKRKSTRKPVPRDKSSGEAAPLASGSRRKFDCRARVSPMLTGVRQLVKTFRRRL
jgi:hypothetical protein